MKMLPSNLVFSGLMIPEKISKCLHINLTVSVLLTLRKKYIPSNKGCFVSTLVDIAQCLILRSIIFLILRQTDRFTDKKTSDKS